MSNDKYKQDLAKIRLILAETAFDPELTTLILTHQKLHDLMWSIVEIVDPKGFKDVNEVVDNE